MAFGLSGAASRSGMVGGDAVVTWLDRRSGEGFAEDYFLRSKRQCSGGQGACPDTKLQVIPATPRPTAGSQAAPRTVRQFAIRRAPGGQGHCGRKSACHSIPGLCNVRGYIPYDKRSAINIYIIGFVSHGNWLT